MAEKPIIFSGLMVRKLLAGEKTQTRRIVKPLPEMTESGLVRWRDGECAADCFAASVVEDCPYGKPGDTLWVRETCRAKELTTAEAYASEEEYPPGLDGVFYLADEGFRPIENSIEASERWGVLNHYRGKRGATVPPIHMPRWASRITRRLTDVRVQRLMEISDEDARAEGFKGWHSHEEFPPVPIGDGYTISQLGEYVSDSGAFLLFWDKLHGDGATMEDPWVWALTFEVLGRQQGRSAVDCRAHNPEVVGSSPAPASNSRDQLSEPQP